MDTPYGFRIVFERAKPNGGMLPELEEATLTRKGKEDAARRAATLTRGFRKIISITPIAAEEAPRPRARRSAPAPLPAAPALLPATPDTEAAADAIQRVRKVGEELAAIAARKRELIKQMADDLRLIDLTLPEPGLAPSSASKILTRCERLKELFNMEELESWRITLDRFVEEAWRRLP